MIKSTVSKMAEQMRCTSIKTISVGDERIRYDYKNEFIETFNVKTGFSVRKSFVGDKDVFMSDYPLLIDVGTMGTCFNSINGFCEKAGIQCYQNAPHNRRPNMSVENFRKIAEESKGKCFQFALGGAGDPNKHEHFEEILKICVDNDIVPNYTTSGFNLTDEEVALTKQYCGAVAVSDYRNEWTKRAVEKFIDSGCLTNIHFVLGNNTIDYAIECMERGYFYKNVNAVIFLSHKPVGMGSKENVLSASDGRVQRFFELVDNCSDYDFQIGFDSCTIPGILNMTNKINLDSVDYCESSRYSLYVDCEMNAMPCSFCNQDNRYYVSLATNTIYDAWNSSIFNDFRCKLKNTCVSCSDRKFCGGGCPVVNEITLCNRQERGV